MDQERLDVDARFLLANERTLLAWVRTALTLLAAGFAVQQLASGRGSTALAVLLLLTGAAAAVAGGVRNRAADRAIRAGALPPAGRSPYALVVVVALLGVLALVVVLLAD